jgi:hypothetical protein
MIFQNYSCFFSRGRGFTVPRVTRRLEKMPKIAQNVAKSKKAKISTTKLYLKAQNIYIKLLLKTQNTYNKPFF